MKKILIADDEENLRVLIATTLEGPECEIMHAAEGPVALEMAVRENPDLVILDWAMPKMTGIEVLQAIRESPQTSHLPVIMLTARGQDKDRALAMTLGADSYLVKPFSPLELLEKVQQALTMRNAERESNDELRNHGPEKRIARSA